MTRPMSRRLLTLALMSALSLPVWAQSALAPFTVTDIRIDGLQRIGAGTVFTYLPVERGDTLDQARAAEALRALYKTGFFEDVRLDHQGGILVVTVVERPAINKLTLVGNKDLKSEDLLKGLKDIGLAEGETFDRLNLDRVTQELNRQYNNRGKYNVKIDPAVGQLDRNRVDVTLNIKEGKAAKIRHINLVGNEIYTDEDITEAWESHTSNWLSWYKRDDQYSREKLSGDIEKLNAWYLNRGFLDFSLDSTQVAISPDKKDMYLTAGLTEGEAYNISAVTVSGDTILPKEEVEKLAAFLQPGNVFSRRLVELATDSISARLSNIGYAFAQVTPIPTLDRDKRTVSIDLQVQPGPRVNVRRIVFKGNTRTADVVLRREMRQFEGSWYSQAAIDRSKVRLQRLGYFEEVNVENEQVAGSDDLVDVVYTVKETTSGSISAGVGYSQLSGLNLSLQLSENNFLGSGNRVSMAVSRSAYQKRYDFSFMNPYFTKEGMSLGYNLWWREFDYSSFNVAQYSTNSGAAQVFMSLPLSESDSVSLMFGIDSNEVLSFPGSTPQPLVDYVECRRQPHLPFRCAPRPGGRVTPAMTISCRSWAAPRAFRWKSRCRDPRWSTTSCSTTSRSTGCSIPRSWCVPLPTSATVIPTDGTSCATSASRHRPTWTVTVTGSSTPRYQELFRPTRACPLRRTMPRQSLQQACRSSRTSMPAASPRPARSAASSTIPWGPRITRGLVTCSRSAVRSCWRGRSRRFSRN